MKRLIITLCFILITLVLINPAAALNIEVGDKFHITGCERGELLVPIINMWSKPGGISNGARVIGKLSGNGRADQGLKCQGSIVELLEIRRINGRTYLKIKTIYSDVGWITDSFVGRKVVK